jgi:co-chaperonin GroES (HSP10)
VHPARGLVLLKPVETEERFAGSRIVLLDSTRERWTGQQAEVVAVGKRQRCVSEDCERHHDVQTGEGLYHPMPVEPGNWVLVEPRQYVELEDQRWVVPADSIIGRIVP